MTGYDTVGHYIVEQLRDRCGIKHIFGVPGDFSFGLNDAIADLALHHDEDKKVHWIGTLNELNAAYSCDGYAREQGYGAINTTFMVGELSAVNGIAATFAHSVPIFHMVGMPDSKNLRLKSNHHTLGPDGGTPLTGLHISEHVTADAATILDITLAKSTIDYLITSMIRKKKPVYLAIPRDLSYAPMPHEDGTSVLMVPPYKISAIQKTMAINQAFDAPVAHSDVIDRVAISILSKMSYQEGDLGTASIALGSLLKRCPPQNELRKALNLLNLLELPCVAFPDDKCVVQESHPLFLGMISHILNSDQTFAMQCYTKGLLVEEKMLTIGCLFTDLSPGYTAIGERCIKTQIRSVKMGTNDHSGVPMHLIIDALIRLAPSHYRAPPKEFKPWPTYPHPPVSLPTCLSSNELDFEAISAALSGHLCDYDTLYCEVGTIMMTLLTMPVHKSIRFEQQTLWGSIGGATPGAFGVAVAKKQCSWGRTVLVTGEGSHMMTIQNLACYFHYGEHIGPVTIMNIDNEGYTIEKLLTTTPVEVHSVYNNLPQLDYPMLAEGFSRHSDTRDRWTFATTSSCNEMRRLLTEAKETNKSLYLTVKIDPLCAPEAAKHLMKVMYE